MHNSDVSEIIPNEGFNNKIIYIQAREDERERNCRNIFEGGINENEDERVKEEYKSDQRMWVKEEENKECGRRILQFIDNSDKQLGLSELYQYIHGELKENYISCVSSSPEQTTDEDIYTATHNNSISAQDTPSIRLIGKRKRFISSDPLTRSIRVRPRKRLKLKELNLPLETYEELQNLYEVDYTQMNQTRHHFRCKNLNHEWIVTHRPKPKNFQCMKCKRAYLKCKKYVIQNNGILHNKKMEKEVHLECAYKHLWKVDYNKYLFQKWCPICKKGRREAAKRKIQEECKIRQTISMNQQNKLFEEAKVRMKEEQEHIQSKQLLYHLFAGYKTSYLSGAISMEDQIDCLAREKATSYMSQSTFNVHSTFHAIIMIYNILLASDQFLQYKFQTAEQREKKYRKMAILVHPDKNQHPQALEAFQKLLSAYQNSKL